MDKNSEKFELSDFGKKVQAGAQLAFKRLVEKAKAEDDYLVFSENGKPYQVKARDLK